MQRHVGKRKNCRLQKIVELVPISTCKDNEFVFNNTLFSDSDEHVNETTLITVKTEGLQYTVHLTSPLAGELCRFNTFRGVYDVCATPTAVYASMHLDYRLTIVGSVERRDALHDLLSHVISQTTSNNVEFFLGYMVSCNTDENKLTVSPGVPLCANHCDVLVPRSGKLNSLAIKKRKLVQHASAACVGKDEDEDKDGDKDEDDPVERFIAPLVRKRLHRDLEPGDLLGPKDPEITETIVIIKKKGASPGIDKISNRVVKRRDYAQVYRGDTSAVKICHTFYRHLCRHPEDTSDDRVLSFVSAGGFRRAYITLPRMQRRGMHSIANVMLNFYMEIPAREIVLCFRLLEHCDIDKIVNVHFKEAIVKREESLLLLGQESCISVFPLIPYVAAYPRLFVSHNATNNIPVDITYIFVEQFKTTPEFIARHRQRGGLDE